MTATENTTKPTPLLKLPMILGGLLFCAGAAGGFYGTSTGVIFADRKFGPEATHSVKRSPLGKIAYIEVAPITVTLGSGADMRHLRFRSQLEVPSEYVEDVEHLIPRVVDVFNTYLRAITPFDIERPSGLIRIRAQLLRRVRILVGPDRVTDLLVMEFVIN